MLLELPAPLRFHGVELALRRDLVPLKRFVERHDFDVTPGLFVRRDGPIGEGVVVGVAEDDVEFAVAVQVGNGPLGEPLGEEVVVLSDVVVIRFHLVRAFAFPLFAGLEDAQTRGGDDRGFVRGDFVVPFVAHEAVGAWVGFLQQPVYLRVDVREDLHAAAEDIFA